MSGSAVTWWGHASVSVELGGATVAIDPLLVGRLVHLRRRGPVPPAAAAAADLVLISHLHMDHLHVPSLDRFDPRVPVVVPRGAARSVRGLAGRELVEVAPGESVTVAGVALDVLPAHHDGRRFRRGPHDVLAVGYRLAAGGTSVWYPGDTGVFDELTSPAAVDLAIVPIGGWGPSLGDEHLDPDQAAAAAAGVGARHTLAVHYGTFWPMALERLHPSSHHHFFVTPAVRFRAAAAREGLDGVLTPAFGERVELT